MPNERTLAWWHRSNFSQYGAPLGWGAEYWDVRPENYEGAAALTDRLQDLGFRPSRRYVALQLSDSLLDDVLIAAGGVERAVDRLHEAAKEAKAAAGQAEIRGTPELPTHGLSHPASIEAAYAFADTLAWVRAFDERLDRPRYQKGVLRRQGLLPAIRPKRLRERVQQIVDTFRGGSGGDCRNLANLTLHSTLVRNPMSGVQVDESGEVHLPIPETPTGRVYHSHQLNWANQRDGFAFAGEVRDEVRRAVDDLLDAFEEAIPKRFRTT